MDGWEGSKEQARAAGELGLSLAGNLDSVWRVWGPITVLSRLESASRAAGGLKETQTWVLLGSMPGDSNPVGMGWAGTGHRSESLPRFQFTMAG